MAHHYLTEPPEIAYPSMRRFLRTGRARISRTSQKVQSYLFIFFPSVDERLFSIIRPEMASPSSPENEYQVMAKSHPTRRPGANNMPLPSCHGPAVGMPPSRRPTTIIHKTRRNRERKNPTEKIMGKPCFAAGFPLISWIGVPLDRRIVERTETL